MIDDSPRTLSGLLRELTADTAPDEITLGALLEAVGSRAFGAALFALALPCAPPFLYIVPQIVAVPMLLLAAQLAAGREAPWLPSKLRARRVEKAALAKALKRARPLLSFLERVVKPRQSWITGRTGGRIVGVFLTAFSLSVLIPLPGTNTVPGIATAVAAFGLAERDGLTTLGGLALGLFWIALLFAGGAAAATALLRSVMG